MWKIEQHENTKLCEAAVESLQTGRITPLLKEELKYYIQYRRMSEGKDELVLSAKSATEEQQKLRPEEIEKIKKRKEQNRKASEKFRNKKKSELHDLEKVCRDLLEKNIQLKNQVRDLEAQKQQLFHHVTDILRHKINPEFHQLQQPQPNFVMQ